MKKLFLFFLGAISFSCLKAQSESADIKTTSRSVYVELLGSGLAVSANYDSRFSGSKGFGYRVGIGFIPLKGSTPLTFPLGVNAILGHGPSYLEVEATATILTSTKANFNGKKASAVFFYPHIGYRYTKPTKSIFGRIVVGPMLFGSKVIPYGGLSLGYTL